MQDELMVVPEMQQPCDSGSLNQYLARSCQETVNFLLHLRINHMRWSLAIRTWQARRRSKQAADQRAFTVYLASMVAQVWAAQFGQGRCMLLFAPDRKPGHLIRGCSDRPTTIVASRLACECRNASTEKTDLLTIFRHPTAFLYA